MEKEEATFEFCGVTFWAGDLPTRDEERTSALLACYQHAEKMLAERTDRQGPRRTTPCGCGGGHDQIGEFLFKCRFKCRECGAEWGSPISPD